MCSTTAGVLGERQPRQGAHAAGLLPAGAYVYVCVCMDVDVDVEVRGCWCMCVCVRARTQACVRVYTNSRSLLLCCRSCTVSRSVSLSRRCCVSRCHSHTPTFVCINAPSWREYTHARTHTHTHTHTHTLTHTHTHPHAISLSLAHTHSTLRDTAGDVRRWNAEQALERFVESHALAKGRSRIVQVGEG